MKQSKRYSPEVRQRAVVVAVRDGFVLWARSSSTAFRSKVYLSSKKRTIPIPDKSVLNRVDATSGAITGKLGANAWFDNEPSDVELTEHAIALGGDYPYTLGLLLLPAETPRWESTENELLAPVYQSFQSRK